MKATRAWVAFFHFRPCVRQANLTKLNAVNAAQSRISAITLSGSDMNPQQDWHTESYKGMDVHVSPLPRDGEDSWDFTVRIAQPGEDASSASELTAQSGDDEDYPTKEAAIDAGFAKGYAMVDGLLK